MKKTVLLFLKNNWPAIGLISCSFIFPILGLNLEEREETPSLISRLSLFLVFAFMVVYALCFKQMDLGEKSDLGYIFISAMIMLVFSLIFSLKLLPAISIFLATTTAVGILYLKFRKIPNPQKEEVPDEEI